MVQYKCNRCNKIFKKKCNYDSHKARKRPCKIVAPPRVLKNAPKFPCSICNKKYTRKFNLSRHLYTAHGVSGTDFDLEQDLEQKSESVEMSPDFINYIDEYSSDNDSEKRSVSFFGTKDSKNGTEVPFFKELF